VSVTVVAHAARSGIAALNVVTAALEVDARTRDVPIVFAKSRAELAAAIADLESQIARANGKRRKVNYFYQSGKGL
jgi:hypothetical protein